MKRNIFTNSLWMILEKAIAILGLIFVTSYVAKYVGTEIFGEIAYATSLFQIVQVVSQLGSDVLIFKRISKNTKSGIKLIQSTIFIRIMIYCILSLLILFYLLKEHSEFSHVYMVAAMLSCFFSAMDVYSIYYDVNLLSKYNTIVNALGLTITLLIRWIIAFYELKPEFLCVPIILTGLIPFVIRFVLFRINEDSSYIPFKHMKKYIMYMIKAGSTIVISSVSVAIYTRVSVIVLGFFLDKESVGVYSVAASLGMAWSFIPNSFITSSLPSIFSEKDNSKAIVKAANLNLLVFFVCIPFIVGGYLFGFYFIKLLYGDSYIAAYYPMVLLCIATMFAALGTVASRFITHYSGYSFLSKKTILVLFFSLILSCFFVKYHGVTGAAISIVITEVLSLTLFNYLFNKGIVFKLHLKTVGKALERING